MAAGAQHNLALKSDGTVWSWGRGSQGELGNNGVANSSTPVQVSGLNSVVAVAAGDNHNLALRSDGKVWSWGAGTGGALGNGATADQLVPVPVGGGLTGIVEVSAGQSWSMARTTNGEMFTWGLNTWGQLGNGTFVNSSTPAMIPGFLGVSAIAAGNEHGLAVYFGNVVSWGRNNQGQLGVGNTTTSPAPQFVAEFSAVDVAAGGSHGAARRADGTMLTWGSAIPGALGLGFTPDRLTPAVVDSLGRGVASLGTGAGLGHTLVITQPHLSLPPSVSFPSQDVGSVSASKPVTIRNDGAASLFVAGVTLSGNDASQFSHSGPGCTGATLEPGESCTVGVQFAPDTAGAAQASLRILSNSPSSPTT